MNWFSWVLLAGAVIAASAAVQAGNNLDVAVPAGAAAVLLVAVVGAARLRSTASRLIPAHSGMIREMAPTRDESDSLLRLRRAFRGGPIGRSSIVATIRSLERDLYPASRTALSLESERALLQLPPDQFRQWVDDRLLRIEALT
ncbi:MAG: hypothetical protein L3K14_02465 [Thermoplasmata archaeon]|nr:hypothetical protein [Thermoplasmata archaeon]